jgi:purine catabolism regulator
MKKYDFADLTKAAHERILRPSGPSDHEQWMDSLLDAGRDRAWFTVCEGQLGPILALPGRPRGTLLATWSSAGCPLQHCRDGS